MKKEILYYRIVLFLGLGVSASVVLLFKHLDRELAAQIASLLFLIFGVLSFEAGRRLKDAVLSSAAVLFVAVSVLPILVIKYFLQGSNDLILVFHKIGNATFFAVNLVALVRLFRLRLKLASVTDVKKD